MSSRTHLLELVVALFNEPREPVVLLHIALTELGALSVQPGLQLCVGLDSLRLELGRRLTLLRLELGRRLALLRLELGRRLALLRLELPSEFGSGALVMLVAFGQLIACLQNTQTQTS